MRPNFSLCLWLSAFGIVQAKYYSDGWKPGQARSAVSPGATFDPIASAQAQPAGQSSSFFDLSSFLTRGPLGTLLGKAGINVTQAMEEARVKQANLWDSRIPLITDDNYEDVIVNERLTPQEEVERIWFIIVTVTSAQPDGMSKMFDTKFDETYELTVKEGDLKHVKWGRVDYLNVTRITTKWNVWRGPMLIVLSNRGQTLRFLNTRYLRPQPELIRNWLLSASYLELEPWASPFRPGGKSEFILDWAAIVFEKWYNVATTVPRWLFYILSGGAASILISVMHRGTTKEFEAKKKAAAAARQAQAALEASKTKATTITSGNRTASGPSKRKTGKT